MKIVTSRLAGVVGIFISLFIVCSFSLEVLAAPPKKVICPAPESQSARQAAVEAACRHFGMVPGGWGLHSAFGPNGEIITCIHFSCRTPASGRPVVENVAWESHPTIPSALKVTCLQGPNTLHRSSTCPVIKWRGYTYWAYSHRDNRSAMTIVAYDAAGNFEQQWYKTGARYVWRITVDMEAETVTFWGQSNRTIVMTWDELRVPGS